MSRNMATHTRFQEIVGPETGLEHGNDPQGFGPHKLYAPVERRTARVG